MSAKRLCSVCRQRPAEIPDRERMGRLIARVCRECHGNRLAGDLLRVLKPAEREKILGVPDLLPGE